ncbi:MAG: Kelch motif protein [Limisphaerales bacterium]|nr:MAG: Kelch motif protein [Limisphaerales bacterium]KAG0510830.1 MAG: Kelch motif protein [Limisphaerales bacterium]TXT48956.1 MAG: Kelch motif protein [Limisphaerales bacterium]
MKRTSSNLPPYRVGGVLQWQPDGAGWNGQPGRARRQPAAELRHCPLSNCLEFSRRSTSGERVARRNGPVARSTRISPSPLGFLAALLLAFTLPALAADSLPPGRISYQGFLTDTAGIPLGAAAPVNATVTFRIYRSAGGTTAADVVWAETQIVTVDRGHYSVTLGSGSPTGQATDAGKFTNNLTGVFLGPDVSERYLGVRLGGGAELSPRVQFMASPFVHASRAAAGLTGPDGNLLIRVGPAGLGVNLTNNPTATVDVGGTVRATAFQGSGTGLSNVTTTVASLVGTLSGAQIADGAITVAKLVPGTVPGSALANGSLETNKLTSDALNLILSQAGGVGAGGGVFSLSPTNASLTSLGFVNVGSRRIGGDRWTVKASEVTPNAPVNRNYNQGSADMRAQETCWTGTKWIVWGGLNANESTFLGTGAMFDPVLNTWTPISTQNAPSARHEFQCIWLGDRMWLYGGYNGGDRGPNGTGNGFFYNPTTDQWTSINSANSAGARARFSACWTGTEIIVFGGFGSSTWVNTGARYNPATDTWRSMASNPQRGGFGDHCFAWTGTEMIIAGGHDTVTATTGINKAARYNPVLDNWTPMPDIPFSFAGSSSAWTGTEYLYGFGHGSSDMRYARYSPVSNTWSAIQTAKPGLPNDGTGKVYHQAAWTGTEWLIVGGWDGSSVRGECARFNPATSKWTRMPNVPKQTPHQPFTWTGKELLIFSGWLPDTDQSVISYQPPIEAYQYVKQ